MNAALHYAHITELSLIIAFLPTWSCYRSLKPLWLVFLQIVTCFGLPWSKIEPGTCTNKFVVVDDVEQNDLTIPYDICQVAERPTCINTINQCEGNPIQRTATETILEALFVDKSGNVNNVTVSHDGLHFNVSNTGWELPHFHT